MAGGNPYIQFPEGQKWHNWSWWQYPASGASVRCEQSGDLILVICDLASLLYGTSFVFTQLEFLLLANKNRDIWPKVMLQP